VWALGRSAKCTGQISPELFEAFKTPLQVSAGEELENNLGIALIEVLQDTKSKNKARDHQLRELIRLLGRDSACLHEIPTILSLSLANVLDEGAGAQRGNLLESFLSLVLGLSNRDYPAGRTGDCVQERVRDALASVLLQGLNGEAARRDILGLLKKKGGPGEALINGGDRRARLIAALTILVEQAVRENRLMSSEEPALLRDLVQSSEADARRVDPLVTLVLYYLQSENKTDAKTCLEGAGPTKEEVVRRVAIRIFQSGTLELPSDLQSESEQAVQEACVEILESSVVEEKTRLQAIAHLGKYPDLLRKETVAQPRLLTSLVQCLQSSYGKIKDAALDSLTAIKSSPTPAEVPDFAYGPEKYLLDATALAAQDADLRNSAKFDELAKSLFGELAKQQDVSLGIPSEKMWMLSDGLLELWGEAASTSAGDAKKMKSDSDKYGGWLTTLHPDAAPSKSRKLQDWLRWWTEAKYIPFRTTGIPFSDDRVSNGSHTWPSSAGAAVGMESRRRGDSSLW
jgi:hypothetical protein